MAGKWREHEVSALIDDGVLLIGDGYRAKIEELASSGLPFARAGNVNNGFQFDKADRFPEANLSRVGHKISEPGDVVFTSKGTVGRFGFVRASTPRFVYSPQLCFWRSLNKDIIDPRFLYFWMHGREFFVQLKGVAGQTDMAEYVSLWDQRRMHITLPPLAEQRAIAHILGTLDDKIELNRRMSETLEQMVRALFKAWFVDFEPVRAKCRGEPPCSPQSRQAQGRGIRQAQGRGIGQAQGPAPTGEYRQWPQHILDLFPGRLVPSELGEIPEGWEMGTMGDVVEQLRDQENPLASPEALYQHFSIPAFDEGQWPKEELGKTIKSFKFRVPPGVILLSKLNPEIERVWLVDVQPSDRAVCSTEFLVLRPQPPAGRAFAYCLARSPVVRQELQGMVTGTSKSHQRASAGSILGLRAVRPPAALVEAFERLAGTWLGRILECRRESRTLAALRDALLPKLISGQIRVKDAERMVGRCV